MKYMVHVDWYVAGEGFVESEQVLDSYEHCDGFFPAEDIEEDLEADGWFVGEDGGDWHNVRVDFYADDADPMFDAPIKTAETHYTIQ